MRAIASLSIATALVGGCVPPSRTITTTPAQPADATAIPWHEWDEHAFARARRERKLILVDVGMEGCTACRWMDEDTYADPEIVRRIGESFIAIQVDAEARPDLGDRYSSWAWPATIFMSPDGVQLLALRGNKRPRTFMPILDQLVAAQRAGTLTAEHAARIEVSDAPEDSRLERVRARVVGRLDRFYDAQAGGWSRAPKIPLPAAITHAWIRAQARGESQWREHALLTLEHELALIDPVWGGMFVGSAGERWDAPIPEKRIAGQAGALSSFARAYAATGDRRWLAGIDAVDRYLRAFMQSDDGTFFTSQEDEAPRLPEGVSPRDYYGLDDAARRRFGVPPVDHAVYTDKNALVISAYVDVHEATGDERALATALRAANALVAARRHPDGWFVQTHATSDVARDDRMRPLALEPRMYLRTQAAMGLALLALYRATGDAHWLEHAVSVADAMDRELGDATLGGFRASNEPSVEGVPPPGRPLGDNAVAARLLLELAVYAKRGDLRTRAERVIRAISHDRLVAAEGRMIGDLAIALELLTTGLVEFSIVGAPSDPRARALHAAALRVFEPRKVLHFEPPGRYPVHEHPALYVCDDEACSAPVFDPEEIATAAARFAR